jgi:arylamine N-acetyltransferase
VVLCLLTYYRVHIVNIVTFPDGSRWTSDVAFGGDGPTEPIELKNGASILNLGTQDARLTRGFIPGQSEQDDLERRWWIYECRNGEDKPWHSFYCFSDRVEWLVQDFGVSNWFTGHSPESFQTTTVLAVKFLRRPKTMNAKEAQNGDEDGVQEVYGKVMLVNETVKENLGGKTRLLQECKSERERIEALKKWFGIDLDEEEQRAIDGFKTAIR